MVRHRLPRACLHYRSASLLNLRCQWWASSREWRLRLGSKRAEWARQSTSEKMSSIGSQFVNNCLRSLKAKAASRRLMARIAWLDGTGAHLGKLDSRHKNPGRRKSRCRRLLGRMSPLIEGLRCEITHWFILCIYPNKFSLSYNLLLLFNLIIVVKIFKNVNILNTSPLKSWFYRWKLG